MPFTQTPPAFTWDNLNDTWGGLDSFWARGVFIEFGTFTGFKLNSPEQGVLDKNVLDGDILFESLTEAIFYVEISRGKDKDIARTSAGSLSVSLRNQNRLFDPLTGFYKQYALPRIPIRATLNGQKIFTGFVDDWNYNYEVSGESIANIQATDAFSQFSRQLNAGGSAPIETTGARLNRILDQTSVNFIGPRDIDTGNSILAGGLLEGETLNYMLSVIETSELGLLFMGKDGTFKFRERLVINEPDPITLGESGIPFENVVMQYGSQDLVNQVVLTGAGGTVVRDNRASQVQYGITGLQLETQVSTLAGQQGLADFIVARFSDPEFRVQSVTTNLRALTDLDATLISNLEIGDQVDVVFTPNNIAPAIAVRNRIIGISHSVSLEQHFVSFSFEDLPFTFFILDDPVFGKLDEPDVALGF
jgi:hypothetical protein